MKRIPALYLSVVRFAQNDVIATSVPGILTPTTPSNQTPSQTTPPTTPIIPYKPKDQ